MESQPSEVQQQQQPSTTVVPNSSPNRKLSTTENSDESRASRLRSALNGTYIVEEVQSTDGNNTHPTRRIVRWQDTRDPTRHIKGEDIIVAMQGDEVKSTLNKIRPSPAQQQNNLLLILAQSTTHHNTFWNLIIYYVEKGFIGLLNWDFALQEAFSDPDLILQQLAFLQHQHHLNQHHYHHHHHHHNNQQHVKHLNHNQPNQQSNQSNQPSTNLCAFFAKGNCRYGEACRFSHTLPTQQSSLPSTTQPTQQSNQPQQNGTATTTTTTSADSTTQPPNSGSQSQQNSNNHGKQAPCRFFNMPSGCRNGSNCSFAHVLIQGGVIAPSTGGRGGKGTHSYSNNRQNRKGGGGGGNKQPTTTQPQKEQDAQKTSQPTSSEDTSKTTTASTESK